MSIVFLRLSGQINFYFQAIKKAQMGPGYAPMKRETGAYLRPASGARATLRIVFTLDPRNQDPRNQDPYPYVYYT